MVPHQVVGFRKQNFTNTSLTALKDENMDLVRTPDGTRAREDDDQGIESPQILFPLPSLQIMGDDASVDASAEMLKSRADVLVNNMKLYISEANKREQELKTEFKEMRRQLHNALGNINELEASLGKYKSVFGETARSLGKLDD